MNTRKGQAALEFLTTYGWMLLIVVAVIGAMTYYGFGNAKNAVPSSCYLGDSFNCKAHYVNTEGQIGLEIENLERKAIVLNATLVKYPGVEDYLKAEFESGSNNKIPIGESVVVFIDPTASSAPSEFNSPSFSGKDKFGITLVYTYDEPEALVRTSSGELIGDIVEDTTIASQYESEAINVDEYSAVSANS